MYVHDKQFMAILAAHLMPAANGNVKNALNLAEGLMQEIDKRWPDVPVEERGLEPAGAPVAQTAGNQEGGQ